MTYRNDHEAALHRIDALEAELSRVRRSTETSPAPPPAKISRAFVIVLASLGLVSAAVFKLLPAEAREPEPRAAPALAPDLLSLATCRAAIVPSPHLGAASMHPDHPKRPIRALVPTGAACREDIESAAFRATGSQRDALVTWLRAEDELAGAISRMVVYYESDPIAADGYRSAPQLWSEYDHAIKRRDAALVELDAVGGTR